MHHSAADGASRPALAEESASLTDLVDEIEAGKDWAWSTLVRRLAPAVQAAVGRYNVDEELRNDAMAETWRVLFERLETVEDPERLYKWVSVVAGNQLMSMLRRPAYQREVAAIDRVLEVVTPIDDTDRVVESEVSEQLDRAVSKLTTREQAVVRCRVLTDEPESLKSMECRHGIPAGSVGPTLGRSVKKLRRDPQLIRFFDELDGRPDRGSSSLQRAAS